jgi:hypothetical protein
LAENWILGFGPQAPGGGRQASLALLA